MNGALVPANTKKSVLILGFLRPLPAPDLVILIGGILITVGLLALVPDVPTWLLMLFCIPMLLGLLLVLPIPNYHNTLCVIQSIINFYTGQREYKWKGWCAYDEYKDSK